MTQTGIPTPPALPSAPTRFAFFKRFATFFKLGGIGILLLILLIPIEMIYGVLQERLQRRNEAVNEITSTWGEAQTIVGPVLIVPYVYYYKDFEDETINNKIVKKEIIKSAVDKAYFLPEQCQIDGSLNPKVLHRGIYEAVVYNGALTISGVFNKPNFKEFKVEEKDILWEDAALAFAIPDLRGTREKLQVRWGSAELLLIPGIKLFDFQSGVQAKVPGLKDAVEKIPYSLKLTLNGSSSISFAPVGVENTAKISSSWPDPGFIGAFLPVERNIRSNGFDATWQVSYYGRNYPQSWKGRDSSSGFSCQTAYNSSFGVRFVNLVDSYRTVERSIKYAILFIVLVFTTFFLFEIISLLRIHALQYTLVGFALCLFYLALLSLSEFISFGLSYLAAAIASTTMISLYSHKILKSGQRTKIVMCGVAAIYGFLYVILQMQDYSLLFGTIGLFIALALVMYATRNIDWYKRDQE